MTEYDSLPDRIMVCSAPTERDLIEGVRAGMLLEGKKGLIIGVANKHSIAWAIAQSAAREGAQMLFSYQSERLRENVEELVQTLPGSSSCVCDVGDDSQIDAMMKQAGQKLGRLDFLVHSLAFAPREELTGEFVNTTRQGFATALDVSAYSLVAVTRAAVPLMTEGGSVVTLTYLGSERVVPHYNVMGVAKAALEATVRYLAHDLGPKNIRVNAVLPDRSRPWPPGVSPGSAKWSTTIACSLRSGGRRSKARSATRLCSW